MKAVSDDSQRALTHMSADMRREQMRQKWEAEEEAALNKPVGDVHYANVQYDGEAQLSIKKKIKKCFAIFFMIFYCIKRSI